MRHRATIAATALALLLGAGPAAAQVQNGCGWEWGMGWGLGLGHFFLGGATMLLFWGIVVAILVMLVRRLAGSRQGPAPPPRSGALEILRERYARGEIDQAEFEERKRVLGG